MILLNHSPDTSAVSLDALLVSHKAIGAKIIEGSQIATAGSSKSSLPIFSNVVLRMWKIKKAIVEMTNGKPIPPLRMMLPNGAPMKNIINTLHFQHQWLRSRGKCGVCGDPWGQRPRNHEAPGGRYANGIIVKEYRVGETMEVEIDLSANHRGSFTFKLCIQCPSSHIALIKHSCIKQVHIYISSQTIRPC